MAGGIKMEKLFLGEAVVLEYGSFRKWGHITEIKAVPDGNTNKGYIVLSNEDYSYKLYLTKGDSLGYKYDEDGDDEYLTNERIVEKICDNEIVFS